MLFSLLYALPVRFGDCFYIIYTVYNVLYSMCSRVLKWKCYNFSIPSYSGWYSVKCICYLHQRGYVFSQVGWSVWIWSGLLGLGGGWPSTRCHSSFSLRLRVQQETSIHSSHQLPTEKIGHCMFKPTAPRFQTWPRRAESALRRDHKLFSFLRPTL